MKKVIITGVAGQLGSYMAEHVLKNTDYSVIGTVRRSSNPNHENINDLYKFKERFQLVFADIGDKCCIDGLVSKERPDFFINFAGNSFVANSWDSPYSHLDTNFTAVLHQLEAIKTFCPDCHYFNAGSSEQFGTVESNVQNELCAFKPRNPYGVSKCSSGVLVDAYRRQYGLYAVQGILYNCESKRRSKDFVSRKIAEGVARIRQSIINGEPFKPIELGNLNNYRDWSHALDFCDGIWKMLNKKNNPQDYLLASGKIHSVREFVQLAFETGDIYGEWKFGRLPENDTFENRHGTLVKISKEFYRPAEKFTLRGDSSWAKHDLGWEPKYCFKEIVKEIVEASICKTAEN